MQHPTEVGHPLGTAQIAKLSLSNCHLFVGEDFSDHRELKTIINEGNCYLVFPKQECNQELIEPYPHATTETFIFIDGTWKKAQKIFWLNSWLRELPRLSLIPDYPSRYILRKVPHPSCLSTLEAICFIIKEFDQEDISPTLEVLDYIQNFQIEKMGKEKFKTNYSKN